MGLPALRTAPCGEAAPRLARAKARPLALFATMLCLALGACSGDGSSPVGSSEAEPGRNLPELGRADEARPPDGDRPTIPAFGMMAWQANTLREREFALIRGSGSGLYRFNLTTSGNGDREPRAPTAVYDRLLEAAASQGVDLLPVLMRGRPKSAGSDRRVAEPPETPREHRTWRERVRFYAERYGPGGRFWRENPQVPYRPLRIWEVWNEPNLRQFWDDRKPNPREYGRLLEETREVLREVDPKARIVSAGLAAKYDGAGYLEKVLDESGACSADAIGIHPYAQNAGKAMDHLERARKVADAAGADRTELWVTEIGWRVGGKGYSAVPTAAAQARAFDRFAAATERRRTELRLGPSIAFALRDRVDQKTGRVDHTAGLRRADDRPRPSWRVWSRWASSARPLAVPEPRSCGR